MPEVLIAGGDFGLSLELARSLASISTRLAPAPDALFERLGSVDLLVIDDQFVVDAVGLVAEIRAGLPGLPLIYCLDPATDARVVRRLILDLHVNELLFRPVSTEALVRQTATLLGVPYSDTPEPVSVAQDPLQRKLSEAWSRARSRMLARVNVLDQAGAALVEGRLDSRLRQQACGEAHKLAGSLGTFGLPAGTRLARELEATLENVSATNEPQALRFAETVVALRLEIERSPVLQNAGRISGEEWELAPALLVSPDTELAARLAEEALLRHWVWQRVPDIAAARAAIADLNPSAALIDVDADTATLEFLSEIHARTPPITAIILTSSSSLMDRVEVARRGGRGFFLKSLPAAEIVGAAQGLLNRLQSRAHVLAVDDDPAVLAALSAILASRGIQVTALGNPVSLWDRLEGSPPDILLLDIEMPQVSGIELCRVVRNDPRWAGIPVVFLTALTDAEKVRRVFAAGADDFVAKPIVGPELITRINNRLERTRLLRSMAEVDALTGLPNRLKCRNAIGDFLRLADRHGQPMGLALLRVDGFRGVNENYGPGAGDEVLRRLGQCLREEFRTEEVAGRWGGNKFLLGLYGLDRQAGLRRINDLLRNFALGAFRAQGPAGGCSEFRVTLSGGVAGYPEDGTDLDSLLAEARQAVRRASEAGGNQVLAALAEYAGAGPRAVDLVVVSADETNTALLMHPLQSEGYRTRALRSGLMAARALCGVEYSLETHVLLIDGDLPGFDSLAFVKQLASAGVLDRTAVIILSPASRGHEAHQALELGATDLIAKPVDTPVLLDHLRQELDFRRSGRPGMIERVAPGTN